MTLEFKDYNIAVVDDNTISANLLVRQLNMIMGINAKYYSGSIDFLDKGGLNKSYNCIITDKDMPGMDGIDLAKLVKEYDCDTSVLMVTGRFGKEELQGVSSGILNGALSKPYRICDIVDLLNQIIK